MSAFVKMALVASTVLVGALSGGSQRQAALAATPVDLNGGRVDSQLPFDAQRLGLIREGASLTGEKVIDSDERSLGKIQILLCDFSKGKIAAALLRSGGKAPLTPVPATCFGTVHRDKARLKATKKQFEGAPHFSLASGEGPWNRGALEETFQYFGVKAPDRSGSEADYIAVDSLLGQNLTSQANEALGQVKSVFLDPAAGQIIYLEIEPANGLGAPGQYYLVPPQSVKLGAPGSGLVLKAGAKHFLAGYHFPKEFPSDLVFPEVALAVYRHYGLLGGTPSSGGLGLSSGPDGAINR